MRIKTSSVDATFHKMPNQLKLFSLQDCEEIIQKHFQSNKFEVLHYEETPTFAPYFSIKIMVSVDNTQREVRFLGKKCSEEVSFQLNFAPNHHFLKTKSLIVFEDQNFAQPKALDLAHIKLVLEALARFHARTIGLEALEKTRILEELLENSSFKESLNALNALIDLYPENGLSHEDFKHKIMGLYENSLRVKGTQKFRRVLCHGSVWKRNLLFKYDGTVPCECKLINFELMQYQPPGLDVLQCIYMATTSEMRQHHFHDLLELYYGCLKSELEARDYNVNELLPWKGDFEASLHEFIPLIKLQDACLKLDEYLRPKLALKEALPQFAMRCYQSDEKFKELMMATLEELRDLVTHPGLTKEDCFKILKNKLGTTKYKLLSYKIVPLGTISGFLGDHNKLKIEVILNNQKPKSLNFFAKFYPKDIVGKSAAEDANVFFKETFIYETFIPMLQNLGVDIINDCAILCYFTRHNDVMVFDDFDIFHYTTFDSRKPFSIDILKLVIKKIAKYHASSIILEEKLSERTKSKYRLGDHYPIELKEAIFTLEENNRAAKCMFVGILAADHELDILPTEAPLQIPNEELKVKIKKGFEMLYELVKPSEEYRNVICHGDLWVNNILVQILDGKPNDCRFIDYQLSRYCPPAQDLLTFIYLTTDRNTRREHLDELIHLYHEELSTNLEKYGYDVDAIYPYGTFIKSVEYMTPQAVCHAALSLQLNLLTSDVVKKLDKESYVNMFLVDRREFITDLLKKDPLFAQRSSDSIQDLREMCMKYF